jgi:glyoxylase-like metal-dependent hydrolase (beta-lactamase superfamily II)
MSGKTAPTDNDSRATQQAPDLARTMHVIDRSRDRPARFFGHNLVVASFHLLACRNQRSITPLASRHLCRPADITREQSRNDRKWRTRMTLNVSRRSLLALGAGLGVGLGAGLGASTMLGGSAFAKAPKLGTQTPYWHRFILGDAEVTIVSDGPLPLGDPSGTFTGVPKEEVKKMLSDNFLSPDNVVLEQNSPIVNTGDKLILFDTGMGTSKAFGPTTGRQQKSMAEAGIKPGDIDAVVCSHAHIDHIGGIVDANDKPLFPNAQIYIAQSDFDFWTDEGKLGSPLKDFVVHARKNLMPVRDRIVFFKDGQEFLPGVQAIAAPGHTVGHTIFMVTSAGKSFAFLGDLSHHSVLLLERPRMEFSYDSDPKQAAESRVKLLTMLATNKIPVMSYHFAWPGYGHVAKAGDGFHYYPQPMQMNL